MPLEALIIALDCVVDTLPWRVHGWSLTCQSAGFAPPPSWLMQEIGHKGAPVVPWAIDAQTTGGEESLCEHMAASAGHFYFGSKPGARSLLRAARQQNLRLVLWTDLPENLWHVVRDLCLGSLGNDFERIQTSPLPGDAEVAASALKKLCAQMGLSPLQCGFVGTTTKHAEASRHSGLAFLGLAEAPQQELVLRGVSARGVWPHCEQLGQELKQALVLAAPGAVQLSGAFTQGAMEEALRTARQGLEKGEAPIGCTIYSGAGERLASSFNAMNYTQNKTAHAEIMAFAEAAGRSPLEARDLILVSTLEPCVMCMGAAMAAGVDAVIYGLGAPYDGGTCRVQAPISPESQMPRILGPIAEEPVKELFREWLLDNQQSPGANFVRQLLEN